jgi:hypothetical protein
MVIHENSPILDSLQTGWPFIFMNSGEFLDDLRGYLLINDESAPQSSDFMLMKSSHTNLA